MPEMTAYEPGTPSWADVASPDPDAAVRFYEGLFGWQASEPGDAEQDGGYRMFLQGEKTVAGIGPIQNEGQPPVWTTYITVADADQTVARVKPAGGSGRGGCSWPPSSSTRRARRPAGWPRISGS